MKTLRWIWSYILPYRFKIICGLMFLLVLDSIFLIWPFFTGGIVDNVIHNGYINMGFPDRMSLLKLYIAGMIGVILFKSVARYSFHILLEKASVRIVADIKSKLYDHLQHLDFKFFDANRTGDIMTRMISDIDMIRHFVVWIIPMTIENIVVFAGVILILITKNVYLTLAMLAVTPFIAVLAFKLASSVRPVYSSLREAYSRLNTVVQENISGNRIVKAFTREKYEIQKFIEENESYRKKAYKAAMIWAKFLPWLNALSGSLTIVVIVIGGIMVINGTLTMGQLVIFNSLIWALNMPMRVMCNIINDMQRFFASAEQVMWLFAEKSEIRKENDISSEATKIKGRIEAKNVGFTYGDNLILKDITFTAEPGEFICIMGPTGSGKSTLVNLIARFYDCTEGEILIDGTDIREYDLDNIRSSVSYAMQDVFLFSDTVEGNIAYGVPDAPMETLIDAAVTADADEFIIKLEDGYDTIIGERGVGLSGGQRQRLALARALVKPSTILILDDTTSSLDIETEYRINAAMRAKYGGRTTFMITHRISSACRADKVIVMMDGTIAEMGSHKELIERKSYYYEIFKQQYEDYDEIMGAR